MAEACCILALYSACCQGNVWLSLLLWQSSAVMGTVIEVKCIMRIMATFETQCMIEVLTLGNPGGNSRENTGK